MRQAPAFEVQPALFPVVEPEECIRQVPALVRQRELKRTADLPPALGRVGRVVGQVTVTVDVQVQNPRAVRKVLDHREE